MPAIMLDGLPVSFREAGIGTDGVPVLLAHCSLAHGGLWKPIVDALGRTRHARAADMPGHGGTAPPPEGRSLQLWGVEACAALVEDMGRPAHLVGLSLGGAILGRLALARPELAVSLTLIEPVWFHLLKPAGRTEEASMDEHVMNEVAGKAAAGDGIGAVRAFVEAWGAPGGFEALGAEGQAYAVRCLQHLRRDFAFVDGHPEGQIEFADVARIAPPAMLVSGERTRPTATAVLDVINEALPSARRRTILGAGHLSPVTHWREVLAELESFFTEAETHARAA